MLSENVFFPNVLGVDCGDSGTFKVIWNGRPHRDFEWFIVILTIFLIKQKKEESPEILFHTYKVG